MQNQKGEAEEMTLTIEIQDQLLEAQLTELLQQFEGNPDHMLQAFVEVYLAQLNRSQYSGILRWEKDALAFQKEIRGEWQ